MYGLEFTSQSAEEQRKISASLDAGVAGIFSVSADFSDSLKKITKNVKMRVDSYQVGGERQINPQL